MPIDPLADEWPYDDAEPFTAAFDDIPADPAPADAAPADPEFADGDNWEDGWE